MGYFGTTHWSVVLAVGDAEPTRAAAALKELCETYWYPLYAFARQSGDSVEDANRLAKILRPVKAKINLIPFNEHPGSEFKRPEESVVLKFQEILLQKKYTVIIRHSKGRDISAACGQLSAKNN